MNDSKALEKQVGGDHYSKLKIQPVEFITLNNWDFTAGSAFKYITRYKDKNGRQDLEKAIHFLELRNQLYSEFQLDDLRSILHEWSQIHTIEISVLDYILANGWQATDHRYKALMLLEQLVGSAAILVPGLTLVLIDYLKFVIAIEYPERPIDN